VQFASKLFRIVFSLLILPLCLGSVIALWQIILSSGSAGIIWTTTLAGALCWILIYILLPEPKRVYVLGHELTHALWSWFFGGKLKKIKVRSDGGHVLITKSNFLISLAPYFFPLYVVLVVVIFTIGSFFWEWTKYLLIFYFLIGMMYSFHVTLTSRILKTRQPDIAKEGYIFSSTIIFLGNMCILLIGIPLLINKVSISTSLNLWLIYSVKIYHYILDFIYIKILH
jgi:hypothetical protein